MLACRKTLSHPVAGKIELPLLIPAFSSKGFGFHTTGRGKRKREYSELAYVLAEFTRYPMQHVMVSAYDLHFDHFLAPKLPLNNVMSYLANSRIVAIDSGGYELSADFDSTEIKTFTYQPKDGFGKKEYEKVLNKITRDKGNLQLIITNFDHGVEELPLDIQIGLARELFNKYPNYLNNFIIKPWTKDSKIVDPSRMSNTDFANLRGFNIIGVTEKDLGKNIIDRLKRIAFLRKGINEAGVSSPIHVWGGLDPVLTPLYFFAGAEIFDGVSWLRYAYINGVAINRQCYSILKPEIGIRTSYQLNEAMAGLENLRFLDNLTSSLQQWVDFEGKDFDMFDAHIKDYLQEAYAIMKTNIRYV